MLIREGKCRRMILADAGEYRCTLDDGHNGECQMERFSMTDEILREVGDKPGWRVPRSTGSENG